MAEIEVQMTEISKQANKSLEQDIESIEKSSDKEDHSDAHTESDLDNPKTKDQTNISESFKNPDNFEKKASVMNAFVSKQVEMINKDLTQNNDQKISLYTEEIKKIQLNFRTTGKKYEDKIFPAINNSLYKSQHYLDNALHELKNWNWFRPEELLKKEIVIDIANISIQDIRLGSFSNSNLANCISAVFMSGIIDNIIVDVDNIKMGYASFQFMKNGEWNYVIVDTLLPYSKESKKYLFLNSGQNDGIVLSLLEKAYAKINGCYEFLNLLSLSNIMLEMGFFQIEKIKIEKDLKDPNFVKKTFAHLSSFLQRKEKISLMCEKKSKFTNDMKNIEASGFGIIENSLHHIMSFEDFSNKDLKFVSIKNIWGSEYNWSGPFANNSDDWEKFKDIRDTLFSHKKFQNDSQNVYYMKIENFLKEFTKIYILRYYSPEMTTFSLKGVWADNSLAGIPSDLNQKYPEPQRRTSPFTKMDSDDKWFNNPQYRLKIYEPTKIVIDFSQLDTTQVGVENQYHSIGFSVFKTSNNKSRVWEMPLAENQLCSVQNKFKKVKTVVENPNHDEVSENHSNTNEDDIPPPIHIQINSPDPKSTVDQKTMVSKEQFKPNAVSLLFLEPEQNQLNSFYTILLFSNIKKSEKTQDMKIPYNLKIIGNKKFEIDALSPTIENFKEDQWDANSSGGPYYMNQNGITENIMWCLNPQYLLNFQSPTSLKIILQKTGKNLKKLKDSKLGLSICYLKIDSENDKPVKQSVVNRNKCLNLREELLQKLLEKTKEHLQVKTIQNPWRKIKISANENYIESSFGSTETACLFLKVLPVEGPLLVVPCLDKPGLTGEFKMTIFSNAEVGITTLDRSMNPVILGAWNQYNSGGSHIYNEQLYSNIEKRTWVTNPIYKLTIESKILIEKPVKIKLALHFAEQNWKSKLINQVSNAENKKQTKKSLINVDSMISLYIMKIGMKVTPASIVFQSPFRPSFENEFEFEFKSADFNKQKSFLVLPATFNVF